MIVWLVLGLPGTSPVTVSLRSSVSALAWVTFIAPSVWVEPLATFQSQYAARAYLSRGAGSVVMAATDPATLPDEGPPGSWPPTCPGWPPAPAVVRRPRSWSTTRSASAGMLGSPITRRGTTTPRHNSRERPGHLPPITRKVCGSDAELRYLYNFYNPPISLARPADARHRGWGGSGVATSTLACQDHGTRRAGWRGGSGRLATDSDLRARDRRGTGPSDLTQTPGGLVTIDFPAKWPTPKSARQV